MTGHRKNCKSDKAHLESLLMTLEGDIPFRVARREDVFSITKASIHSLARASYPA